MILYQTEDGQTQLDVKLENDTVWLTQEQMATLFEKDQSTIARHIANAFQEGGGGKREKYAFFAYYFKIQTNSGLQFGCDYLGRL